MLEFAIAFSLAFGPADAGWTLDIHPYAAFEINTLVQVPWMKDSGRCGIALPHLALVSNSRGCTVEDTTRHEKGHIDQYSAIGPGVMLLYAASGGEAVEDYIGHENSTWFPTDSEKNQCPALRITSDETVRFMPCWNPF